MEKLVTVTKAILTRVKERAFCKMCGLRLEVGKEVVSRNGRKSHYYHKECWEKMFI